MILRSYSYGIITNYFIEFKANKDIGIILINIINNILFIKKILTIYYTVIS